MLWYIIILIRILAQNRREFNDMTTYKYVGKIKRANTESCGIQGVANMGHNYPMNKEGRKPSANLARAGLLL